jgi:hypothetical protein
MKTKLTRGYHVPGNGKSLLNSYRVSVWGDGRGLGTEYGDDFTTA